MTSGEWEVKAPVQGETMAHLEAAAGALRGQGGATIGDATTSRGKQEGGTMRGDTTTRQHIET